MKLVRWPLFIHHCAVCAFRQALGRWHIFRDRPMWFVAEIAYSPKDDDEQSNAFIDQARAELMLRYRQTERFIT